MLHYSFLLFLFAVASVCAQTSSVPAEKGGPGFEKIAESLGFETYTPKVDELYYFGDPAAKTGGALHLSVFRYPLTFRPFGHNSNLVENSTIQGLVFESLLGLHPADYTRMIPALASHWKVSEDKQLLTFRLDPNARFSNGTPVTARDVVASWRLAMDPTIDEPSSQQTYGQMEPREISPYLVEVECKTVNFRNLLYIGCALPILSADEIGEMRGDEFVKKYSYSLPVGSGEYIIHPRDVVPDVSYAFTRRNDYWARDYRLLKYCGNFDTITYTVVEDEYIELIEGRSDLKLYYPLEKDRWEDNEEPVFASNWRKKYRIYTAALSGTSGLAFNMRRPPFDDVRVRKAFSLLFDRERIIKNLDLDVEPLTSHIVRDGNYRHVYDPALAAQLLAEAGWTKKNEDGILVKNGQPLSLEIAVAGGLTVYMREYSKSLRRAGIDLQLVEGKQNVNFEKMMDRSFSIAWFNWSSLSIPNPSTSFHSSLADPDNTNNISGLKNARVDELCVLYDEEFDPVRRTAMLLEIDSILSAEYIQVSAWYTPDIKIAAPDKFGMPEYVLPKMAQRGYVDAAVMSYWWYDEQKAQALEKAEREGKPLRGKSVPRTIDYWKVRKKK